jgi:rod shape determining protein RodA
MKRQVNILATIDWLSVFLYIVLVTFGWLNIFSVNYSFEDITFFSLKHRYTMQLAWIMASFLIILIIFALDARIYSLIAYPAYGFGLVILLAVLIVGTTINDSKSWIVIGPLSLQPAEFAKTATILALAKFLSGFNVKISRRYDMLITLAILAVPALLIMAQPDFGSTIVYGIVLLVLYREGLPGWVLVLIISLSVLFLLTLMLTQFTILIILTSLVVIAFALINRRTIYFVASILLLGVLVSFFMLLNHFGIFDLNKYQILVLTMVLISVIAVILTLTIQIKGVYALLFSLILALAFTYSVDFVFHNIMKEHQRNRVNVMLGLKSDPFGYEYNVRQSKIAIGSGGFSGKGFMQGTQTKFKFVPEQSTDFIFCTVGEEWGFLGSFGLILVYVGLLVRLIFLAERQRSKFSRIYGYGVASILFFHFAVNIGMTIGLFPVIGIPLPFLSYGGSSLLAFTILLFIFLKLDSSRKAYLL